MHPEQSTPPAPSGPPAATPAPGPTPVPPRWSWRLRLLVVAGVLLVAFVGLYIYLGSSSVAGQVQARLQQMLGVEVSVGSARIALIGSSTAQNVTVRERDPQPGQTPPLFRIDEATLELTLFGVLGSGAPASVDLNGAELYLRFDTDGHLLTSLPAFQGDGGAVPPVRIRNGTITLDQVGRPALHLRGADLKIGPSPGGAGYTIQGTLADPEWGHWDADASFQPNAKLFALHLTNPRTDVDMDKLRSLPFVAPSVWAAVGVAGTTSVDFTLTVPLAEKPSYKVLLDIERADINVPSIELKATAVSGKVTIADSLVLLDGVRGQFAEGTLTTSADLNFRTPPATFKFDVQADNISMQVLPRSWKLPEKLSGKVDMTAVLLVVLAPGGVKTSGKGEGDIRAARLGDLPFPKVIRLRLTGDGKRFQFQPMMPSLNPFFPFLKGAVDPEAAGGRNIAVAFQPGDPGQRSRDPVEMFRTATRTVGDLAGAGVDLLWRGMERLTRPRKPGEAISYLEVDTGLDGVDLRDLVKQAGLTLPIPVAGKVSFRIHLGIPLDATARVRDYRFLGKFGVVGLRLAEVRVASAFATLQFANGTLSLGSFAGFALLPIPGAHPLPSLEPLSIAGPAYLLALPAARFDGTGRVGIDPPGNLEANLAVQGVPVDRLLAGLTEGALQPVGTMHGQIQLQVPLARLGTLAAWTVRGSVAIPSLDVAGVRFRDLSIEPRLSAGSLVVPALKGTVQGYPLSGSGRLDLTAPFAVSATVEFNGADVVALPLPAEVQGRLDVQVNVGGNLRAGPTLAGRLQGDRVVLAGLTLDHPSADWRVATPLTGAQVRIEKLSATLARGTITGTGTLPLTAGQGGKITVDMRDIFLGDLAQRIPGLPFRVAGLVEGSLSFGLGPLPAAGTRRVTLDLDLTAPRLLVQDLAIHKATARLRYDGTTARANVRGETLGGAGTAEGIFHLGGAAPQAVPAWEAKVEVRALKLDRLDAELGGNLGLQGLRGTIDLDFQARHLADGSPASGKGEVLLRGLAWQGTTALSQAPEDLRVALQLDGPLLHVRGIESRLAGGTFRLSLGLNLRQFDRSWFHLTLTSAELARLLGPLAQPGTTGGSVHPVRADLASDQLFEGPVEVNVRGNIGREWHGSGAITLTQGRIAGAAIEEVRLPFSYSWSPNLGSGQLTVEDSAGRLGRGQVRGDLKAHWSDNGRSLQVEGGFRFFEVDLRAVFPRWGGLSSLGAGRLAGRLEFAGKDMRSLDDLKATLEATLSKTQALQTPILRGLIPFLKTVRGDLTFDTGYLRAILNSSVIRVQTLHLNSNSIRLSVAGTLTTAGRLDLDAIALVGLEVLVGSGPLATTVNQMPRNGQTPAAQLTDLARLLTDRALHFRITGNLRSPITRLEPLKTLNDETARFLVGFGLVGPR